MKNFIIYGNEIFLVFIKNIIDDSLKFADDFITYDDVDHFSIFEEEKCW